MHLRRVVEWKIKKNIFIRLHCSEGDDDRDRMMKNCWILYSRASHSQHKKSLPLALLWLDRYSVTLLVKRHTSMYVFSNLFVCGDDIDSPTLIFGLIICRNGHTDTNETSTTKSSLTFSTKTNEFFSCMFFFSNVMSKISEILSILFLSKNSFELICMFE